MSLPTQDWGQPACPTPALARVRQPWEPGKPCPAGRPLPAGLCCSFELSLALLQSLLSCLALVTGAVQELEAKLRFQTCSRGCVTTSKLLTLSVLHTGLKQRASPQRQLRGLKLSCLQQGPA